VKDTDYDDYLDFYCEKCLEVTRHIKRGFRGHNLRYTCLECDTLNWEENAY
jgi:hypothetical protein